MVPAVGLDSRMALIEPGGERERERMVRNFVNNRQRALQAANWLPVRQAHRSVCHKHIDLFYPYVPRRNNQGPSLPTALAGITISLTVSLPTFPPSPSFSPSLWSPLHSEKERQTHFHTNGVRACSPATQWNCKYFIFAWKPRAITPWPLSPLFHSLSCVTFFHFFALVPAHLRYKPPSFFWSSKSSV